MDLAAKVYQNAQPEHTEEANTNENKKDDNVEEASFEEK